MELYAKFSNVAQARGVAMTELLTRYMAAETIGVKATSAQNVEMLSRVRANGANQHHVIAAKEVEKRGIAFDSFDFVPHLNQYILPEDVQKMRLPEELSGMKQKKNRAATRRRRQG